jgi:hypothetical protein
LKTLFVSKHAITEAETAAIFGALEFAELSPKFIDFVELGDDDMVSQGKVEVVEAVANLDLRIASIGEETSYILTERGIEHMRILPVDDGVAATQHVLTALGVCHPSGLIEFAVTGEQEWDDLTHRKGFVHEFTLNDDLFRPHLPPMKIRAAINNNGIAMGLWTVQYRVMNGSVRHHLRFLSEADAVAARLLYDG